MEENQPIAPQTQPMPQEDHVGFPKPKNDSGKKGGIIKWVIAGIGVIVIIVVGAVFVLRPPADTTSNQEESGNVLQAVATPQESETPKPTPTSTPEPVEKSEIAIQIQNGTGTAGDASLVKGALEEIDFEDITAENADEQDETETTLTYSSDMPQQVIDEIEVALKKIFDDVRVRRGTVGADFDIRILTGPKSTSNSDDDEDTTESDSEETTDEDSTTEE